MAPSAATAITIAISGAATLPTRRRRFDGGPPGWLPRPPEPPRPALPPRPAAPRRPAVIEPGDELDLVPALAPAAGTAALVVLVVLVVIGAGVRAVAGVLGELIAAGVIARALRPPGGTGPLAARGGRPPGPSAVRTVRLAGGAEFRLAVVAGVLAAG